MGIQTRILVAGLALAAAGQAASAQQIWGKATMKQPFDKEPLREVRIPDWLNETTRFVHGIAETDSWDEAAKAGAQMTEVFFGDARGAKYPSKLLPVHPDSPDSAPKHLAECKTVPFGCIRLPTKDQLAHDLLRPSCARFGRGTNNNIVGPRLVALPACAVRCKILVGSCHLG